MATVTPNILNVVQNDKGYDLTFTVTDENGSPVHLGGATVKFKMGQPGETLVINGTPTCNIVGDGSTGQCTYTVQDNDFKTVGDYDAELEITFSGGSPVHTIPDIKVHVKGELESPT